MATINYTNRTTGPAINDQAASKYVDIGNTRIQWGTVTGNSPMSVTLPASFADTSYSVQVTNAGSGTFHAGQSTKSTTQISVGLITPSNTWAPSVIVDWVAIGRKP